MTRPSIDPSVLISGQQGWDAVLRDLITALAGTPPQYANLAAFPAASSFERCLAVAIDTEKLYLSKGGAWKEVSVLP